MNAEGCRQSHLTKIIETWSSFVSGAAGFIFLQTGSQYRPMEYLPKKGTYQFELNK